MVVNVNNLNEAVQNFMTDFCIKPKKIIISSLHDRDMEYKIFEWVLNIQRQPIKNIKQLVRIKGLTIDRKASIKDLLNLNEIILVGGNDINIESRCYILKEGLI